MHERTGPPCGLVERWLRLAPRVSGATWYRPSYDFVRCPDRGADTLFVNTALGWERLEPELQSLAAGNVAVHVPGGTNGGAFQSGREEGDATAHALARPHPDTGQHCLYLSPENTARVEGIEPASNGRALVQQTCVILVSHSCQIS